MNKKMSLSTRESHVNVFTIPPGDHDLEVLDERQSVSSSWLTLADQTLPHATQMSMADVSGSSTPTSSMLVPLLDATTGMPHVSVAGRPVGVSQNKNNITVSLLSAAQSPAWEPELGRSSAAATNTPPSAKKKLSYAVKTQDVPSEDICDSESCNMNDSADEFEDVSSNERGWLPGPTAPQYVDIMAKFCENREKILDRLSEINQKKLDFARRKLKKYRKKAKQLLRTLEHESVSNGINGQSNLYISE